MESAHYTSWSELFKIHCKAFMVFDHLTSRSPPLTPKQPTPPKKPNNGNVDSIVLQWIYGTISKDLLYTIIKKNTTAYDAWKALADIFQDNKVTRGIYLANKLSNTRLDNFPNATADCQELKMLSDQLADVDKNIDDTQLVMQLITGLNEAYGPFANILQQLQPLPTFNNARSCLLREETRKAETAMAASKAAGTALHASSNKPESSNTSSPHQPAEYRYESPDYRSRGRGS
ncbi:uncharacterized protein LOC143623732 [Bidens hawaiensis]|uniref:uncharacterized protein LOC143623732 n=1 Tax=Bidens hawaiensis TaxID=980011 RepID=UPI0040499849